MASWLGLPDLKWSAVWWHPQHQTNQAIRIIAQATSIYMYIYIHKINIYILLIYIYMWDISGIHRIRPHIQLWRSLEWGHHQTYPNYIYLQFDSTSSRVKVNQKPTLSFSDQTNCPEYNMSVTLSRQVRNFWFVTFAMWQHQMGLQCPGLLLMFQHVSITSGRMLCQVAWRVQADDIEKCQHLYQ